MGNVQTDMDYYEG
nr:unnamed protein product [Callosobruchus analis]